MAKPSMDFSTFVGKLLEEQDGDILREGVRVLAQALMDAEVTALVGAERHERTEDRTGYRNGTRTRTWDTRLGTIDLAIPKVRPGSYFPSLLHPRRRAEQALLTVVQEARTEACAVVINPAGYGHTSVALLDALKTLDIPVVECHLSNPAAREAFRRETYVSLVATGVVSGFGGASYELAVEAAAGLARQSQN